MRISKIWVVWLKPVWSNLRFRKSVKEYQSTSDEIADIDDLRAKVKALYKNFIYKYDDFSMLYDAIDTPPQCLCYLENDVLEDDCDGFHAAIYHLIKQKMENASNNNLITVVTRPVAKSHTMCVFDFDGKRYLVDYEEVIEIQAYSDVSEHVGQVFSCKPLYYHLNTWTEKRRWK
ncbi:MAG: hypothetical protein FWE66_02045 [Oscillospiraceae bacterium]|nr:hypothetical protein [Oscillospiraceae bacterium]